MTYIRESQKKVADAVEALESAVSAHGFGVLHRYDFRQTLAEKGHPIDNDCIVLEICNPKLASEVLARDMRMNLALPCRVSVYSDQGQTRIGMIPPRDILALVARGDELDRLAGDVEATTRRIIDDAV